MNTIYVYGFYSYLGAHDVTGHSTDSSGKVITHHISSSEYFLKQDLGVTTDACKDTYSAYFSSDDYKIEYLGIYDTLLDARRALFTILNLPLYVFYYSEQQLSIQDAGRESHSYVYDGKNWLLYTEMTSSPVPSIPEHYKRFTDSRLVFISEEKPLITHDIEKDSESENSGTAAFADITCSPLEPISVVTLEVVKNFVSGVKTIVTNLISELHGDDVDLANAERDIDDCLNDCLKRNIM